MLIGAAVKQAALKGVVLQPVFSLYSYHGPVFRVLLRATSGRQWAHTHYNFVGHCFLHHNSRVVGWRALSSAWCACGSASCGSGMAAAAGQPRRLQAEVRSPAAAGPPGDDPAGSSGGGQAGCVTAKDAASDDHANGAAAASGADTNDGKPGKPSSKPYPLVLSGPMWTGPLHDAAEIEAIAAEAAALGWTGYGLEVSSSAAGTAGLKVRSKRSSVRPLQELLDIMKEEADSRLPPGYFHMDLLAAGLASCPSRADVIAALKQTGWAAARCHLETKAFRTDASLQQVMEVCGSVLGIPLRAKKPPKPAAAATANQ